MKIELSNLEKHFGTNTAVDIKSFTINNGDILGLVGNNGAGKTTLFRLMLSDQFDEQVFTSLRTRKGLSLKAMEERFDKAWLEYLKRAAQKHIISGNLSLNNNTLCLTRKGIMTSNDIISDLMRAE